MSKDAALLSSFDRVAAKLRNEPEVTIGSGKKGFGSSALQYDGKIFAMLSSRNRFVVKLHRERVAELVAGGDGEFFDPGHGRLMKEWFSLSPESDLSWLSLAKEALEFARTKRNAPKRAIRSSS